MKNATRPLAGGACLVAIACALTACPTTTVATGYTPITGIVIRSSALVAGYGCGTADDQVYRYAAVVSYASADGGADGGVCSAGTASGNPYWVDVFDCFTDGVFENLPQSDTGVQSFDVKVYAFTKSGYDGSGLPASLQCVDGGACPVQSLCPVLAAAPEARWTTTCTATQQQGIPVLAVCGPLGSGSTAGGGEVDGSDAADVADAWDATSSADVTDAAPDEPDGGG